uniref:IRF tryptophan pentad repeat domain-containing protein n=1 Tax=Ciona savignyi TaxID=51511 RepID=H2YMS0_CIOSA
RDIANESFAPEYRDRLRTWLIKMIESGTIPGLEWENGEKSIFRMPWKHAGRQDYNLEEDSKIFMAWAKHSGRYRAGVDKPEPIVWKTRLRCALNKMPDIQEIPERSRLDISEPYRVYRLLPPVHKASQIRRRLFKRSQSHDTDTMTSYPASTSSFAPAHDDDESLKAKLASQRRSSSSELTQQSKQPFPSPVIDCKLFDFAEFLAPKPRANHTIPPPFSSLHFPPGRSHLEPSLNFGGYPIPHLPQPFTLPQTSMAPIIPFLPTPGLAAFRNQLSLAPNSIMGHMKHVTAQAMAADQKYNFYINLDQSLSHNNLKKHLRASTKNRDVRPFASKFEEISSALSVQNLLEKLSDTQRHVQSLESELAQYRNAHARERCAREKLEDERESLQRILGRMGDGLRNLVVKPSKHVTSRLDGEADNMQSLLPDVTRQVKQINMARKRVASPLDLSVEASSPAKVKRYSVEGEACWPEDRSSPFLDVTSGERGTVTSPTSPTSFEMTSREEQPLSRSSLSTDSAESRHFCRRSLSPPQRSSHLSSMRNTIEVT